jgi:hypothetical protein
VVSLCCGVGTCVAMANAVGLQAVGVELDRKRAAAAGKVELCLTHVVQYRVENGTLPAGAVAGCLELPPPREPLELPCPPVVAPPPKGEWEKTAIAGHL